MQERAQTSIVRRRARMALKGPGAWLAMVLFLVGLLAFGLGADYLDSERSARVTAAQECARAVKDVHDSSPGTAPLLPPICGGSAAVRQVPASAR